MKKPTHVVVAGLCTNCGGSGEVPVDYAPRMQRCVLCAGVGRHQQAITLEDFAKLFTCGRVVGPN